ncbi:MAG: hypothetical protein HC915_09070 [Anaerolineae bacterium]|nr:hypothetical protein [Anaerolineae bacterium]
MDVLEQTQHRLVLGGGNSYLMIFGTAVLMMMGLGLLIAEFLFAPGAAISLFLPGGVLLALSLVLLFSARSFSYTFEKRTQRITVMVEGILDTRLHQHDMQRVRDVDVESNAPDQPEARGRYRILLVADTGELVPLDRAFRLNFTQATDAATIIQNFLFGNADWAQAEAAGGAEDWPPGE